MNASPLYFLRNDSEQNEAHQKKCVDHYEQMPGNAWISRIIMKKNAPPKCNKVRNPIQFHIAIIIKAMMGSYFTSGYVNTNFRFFKKGPTSGLSNFSDELGRSKIRR